MRKTLIESQGGDFWKWKVERWPANMVAEQYEKMRQSQNNKLKEKS